jgi:hypothetical protein
MKNTTATSCYAAAALPGNETLRHCISARCNMTTCISHRAAAWLPVFAAERFAGEAHGSCWWVGCAEVFATTEFFPTASSCYAAAALLAKRKNRESDVGG